MYSYRNATGLGKLKTSHMSQGGTERCMQTELAPAFSFPLLSFFVVEETEA